jgi:integrase
MANDGNHRVNFTKKTLDRLELPAEGKRLRIYDLQTKGLLVDVTAAGSKTFYCRRKIKGVSNWQRIGPYPEISIEQARGFAAQINAEVAKGVNPGDLRKALRQEPTLAELFSEYIERHAKKSRKTWTVMLQDFERNLGMWKDRRVSSISRSDVEKLHVALQQRRGHFTANRTVQLLRAVYNKGLQWRIFSGENPASGISLFPEKPRDRFLSAEEAARLLSELEKETNADTRDFVKLAMMTGARKSNILSMRWVDLNLDAGIWCIPETKNGTSQEIYLTFIEIEMLKEREAISKSEFVFPGRGKTKHLLDPKRSWAAIRKRAGLEDITIHDLRRSLAASMASSNANVALIKSALNHKDMKTTLNVYALTGKDAERKAREKAHELWDKALKPMEQPGQK